MQRPSGQAMSRSDLKGSPCSQCFGERNLSIEKVSSLRYEKSHLVFRPVESSDAELLWHWANDPTVRKYSFSPEEIPFGKHLEWFRRKVSSPGSRIYVIEIESEPIRPSTL